MITVSRRVRARRRWRWTLPLTLATLTTALACSVDPGGSAPRTGGTPAGAPTNSIRVRVGDRTFTAELYDNPTARDLAEQLPVTITMDDLHGLEKTGRLPAALTTEGVPAGSDPEVGEIGYYAPGRDLVLYYGDVGYYNGIIRIGRFDTSISAIADEPDGLRVTVERA